MTALREPPAVSTPIPAVSAPLPAAPVLSQPTAQGERAAAGERAAPGERARTIVPGLALALGVAAVATVVGEYVPLVGSAVPGALIGAGVAIAVKPGTRLGPGLKWASTFVLQCSVVLLGAQLSIG